jgi:hypothetical protein
VRYGATPMMLNISSVGIVYALKCDALGDPTVSGEGDEDGDDDEK